MALLGLGVLLVVIVLRGDGAVVGGVACGGRVAARDGGGCVCR